MDEYEVDCVDILIDQFDGAICEISENIELIDEITFVVSNPNKLYNDDIYNSWVFKFNDSIECTKYLSVLKELFISNGCKLNIFE